MKIEKIILFSDTIRTLLQQLKTVFTIIRRILFILLKWRKRLLINTVQINDSFLLSNGLLIIIWQLKNFLWIKINNQILTTNSKGILLHYDRIETPVKIKIVGLFGNYKKEFTLSPKATIQSEKLKTPQLLNNKFEIDEIKNSISQFRVKNLKPAFINKGLTKNFAINIQTINIQIPTFKKENYHA